MKSCQSSRTWNDGDGFEGAQDAKRSQRCQISQVDSHRHVPNYYLFFHEFASLFGSLFFEGEGAFFFLFFSDFRHGGGGGAGGGGRSILTKKEMKKWGIWKKEKWNDK